MNNNNQSNQNKNNSSNYKNKKRSRGHSTSSTISNQLINYARNDNSRNPQADEQAGVRIKKRRIEKPEDYEIFILQKKL